MTRRIRWLATITIATLVTLTGAAAAPAQSVSAPALRAAFVYNFAKFTEWPADARGADGSLVFCIADDVEMAETLEQLVKGRAISGRTAVVRRVTPTGDVRGCHLLYAAGLDARRAADLLALVDRSAVLTVGDSEEFARLGGVAQFFVEEGKMRFAINIDSVQRARLQVSSKLLALARIVRSSDARTH